MKHLVENSKWAYTEDPFPAFRCELTYGRNKRDANFLPVKGVKPVKSYKMTIQCEVISTFETEEQAQQACDDHNKNIDKSWEKAYIETTIPLLPENEFRVIKTREKGTIMVVGGEDTTNRCLFCVGQDGGFRGGVDLVDEATTATVLKETSAGNNCESRCDVVALMDVDQTVVFHFFGRGCNRYVQYTWDGSTISEKVYKKSEWDVRGDVAALEGEADVL